MNARSNEGTPSHACESRSTFTRALVCVPAYLQASPIHAHVYACADVEMCTSSSINAHPLTPTLTRAHPRPPLYGAERRRRAGRGGGAASPAAGAAAPPFSRAGARPRGRPRQHGRAAPLRRRRGDSTVHARPCTGMDPHAHVGIVMLLYEEGRKLPLREL
eukprot:6184006-Pleurochrysis_carterae.AAC.1